ncbi:MAG: hypothetical protein AUJ71_04455 [Candidatus Omnitrophica bacterium CG1_02_49_16]|nr:MAG: hypothetical protein AUJ71_04455 [Candidatus Omnitrophica bacterium CG1_02_49_16]
MTKAEERREFFRVNFSAPLNFKSYAGAPSGSSSRIAGSSARAVSQNISQSGILFQTENNPPELSSILWMDLDFRTLNICKEIEKRALVFNNGLLGRVVRVEEDTKSPNIYDIGVCFLTQDQRNSKEVEGILSEISKVK